MNDTLVIGAGPAGLAIAAALSDAGLAVGGLTPAGPDAPWTNTYGIWEDELDAPGLSTTWLKHRWQDCSAYAAGREIPLQRTYGLFDNARLQADLLDRCARGRMSWVQDTAVRIRHTPSHSEVTTGSGTTIQARLVIDATGHRPVFVQRPNKRDVAMQAAYGIVGRFSSRPVRPQQLVLMDYRTDHLSPDERHGPPTFLYAMDLGNDIFFVEETSLARHPAVPFALLQHRLQRRLTFRGIKVVDVHHVEHCLFPMNLPLPSLQQPVLGYGGAASMVHPVSGYQVGAALRQATAVAGTIADVLSQSYSSPVTVAQAAWQALWPPSAVRNRNLYLFGLESILRFSEAQTQQFFATFFDLPQQQWTGYLSNTLSTPGILEAMWRLFQIAPNQVRFPLATSICSAGNLLLQALRR